MIAKMKPALIVMCGISAIWSPRGTRGQRRATDARGEASHPLGRLVALSARSAILHL
jgi:hypothetical protein